MHKLALRNGVIMNYKKVKEYPEDFLWGASTSAFQIEGAYDEGGKGLSLADVRSFEKSDKIADTKVAMDHYHRWEEDVNLMVELGLKSYRFSIAWTRIYPNGDDKEVNQEGVDFYNKLIDKLLEKNIEPIVTIMHLDFPYSLHQKYGGWKSRQSIVDFERYSRKLFELYGDRVKYWMTINEQGIVAITNKLLGLYEDDIETSAKIRHQMNYHMFLAHASAVNACHEMLPDAKIAPALSYMTVFGKTHNAQDQLAAMDAEDYMSFYLMDVYCHGEYPAYYIEFLKEKGWMFETEEGDDVILKKAKPDYVAINWYTTKVATTREEGYVERMIAQKPELAELAKEYSGMADSYQFTDNDYTHENEWGWNVDPVGFRLALRKMYSKYRLPIMITENGYGERDVLEPDGRVHDSYRIDYLKEHLKQMRLAIMDGVDIFSYNLWSFTDVLSSGDGIDKRYGLVYINREDHDLKDLARIKKDSFYWYKELIKTNGGNLDE